MLKQFKESQNFVNMGYFEPTYRQEMNLNEFESFLLEANNQNRTPKKLNSVESQAPSEFENILLGTLRLP